MMNFKSKLIFFIFSISILSSFCQINAQNAPSKLYFYRNAPSYTETTLFWVDNSNDETGFVIESKLDGENWNEEQRLNANITTYKFTSVDPTKSISYRVKSIINSASSSYSNEVRLVGTASKLEVYSEVPGIRNPKDTTIAGIKFGVIQNQCPVDPSKGKATKISTFYTVQVRTISGSELLSSPVYETRPQIRNNLAQNDPKHNAGHRAYGYHEYGPVQGTTKKLHSIHWSNFDAAEDIVVRVTLLNNGIYSGSINMSDLQIHPEPSNVTKIDDNTIDITLPAASDYTRHYRVAINKKAWALASGRSENSFEAPLYIFVNPIHIAPASAPQEEIKEFNSGQLVVFGSGIFLPNNNYRFFGTGGNSSCREMYVPGDAYLHYGFIFNNSTYKMKVWGRAIYSDEMFDIYNDINATENYEYSSVGRTPWSTIDCTDGNPWNKNPTSWEGRVGFYCTFPQPTIFEGFTNIGGRMGTVVDGGNAIIKNHKDVGYGGGTYQIGSGSVTQYVGCMLVNDDDITYVHLNYTMDHCTSTILHNGTTFQYGWGIANEYNVKTRVTNHVALASDRGSGAGYGKNHGVLNSRLKIGQLQYHDGGSMENFDVWGEENIVINIRLWEENYASTNTVSLFEDKTYKNFNIHTPSRSKNKLWGDQNTTKNQKSYLRFLHFDNLTIANNHIDSINDGNFFEYNEALLLHTITFFTLPASISAPTFGSAPIGKSIKIQSNLNSKMLRADESLPQSFAPLCANTTDTTYLFTIVDAGGGYIALRTKSGTYLKADTKRYGYVCSQSDTKRGDQIATLITDEAKFGWVDQGGNKFALYSKAMGLFLRVEKGSGPNRPVYAASASVADAEIFSSNDLPNAVRSYNEPKFTVYPNPASSTLNIYGIEKQSEIRIYSIQGILVFSQNATDKQCSISVKGFSKGNYLVVVVNDSGVQTRKIEVE